MSQIKNDNCETCIYTFPYWFWTSKEIKNEVLTLDWKNNSLRIYSPFVKGTLYDLNLHQHRGGEVPVLKGVKTSNKYINIKAPLPFPHLNGTKVTMLMEGTIQSSDSFVDPYPANSIRIDYLKVDESFDEDNFIGNLTEWIRCKTGLFWVGKVIPNIFRCNKLKYKSDFKGEQRSNGEVETNFFTLSGKEFPLNKSIWNLSLTEAIKENTPPLFQSIFHDARYMHFNKDYRRAVLDSAIASEEALKYFARKYYCLSGNSGKFKFTRFFDSSKLALNLDRNSKDYFGVSLKEENKSLYEAIEKLWITRHSTAHSANALIREGGKERKVMEGDSLGFIIAVEELIDWLNKVTRKN